jgi:hypothetical protein
MRQSPADLVENIDSSRASEEDKLAEGSEDAESPRASEDAEPPEASARGSM